MLIENMTIRNDLYNLKMKLKNKNHIDVIQNLMNQYKTEINIDIEFTRFEYLGAMRSIRNISSIRGLELPDIEDYEKYNAYYDDEDLITKNYILLLIKNNRQKSNLSKSNKDLILNSYVVDIKELINKHFNI